MASCSGTFTYGSSTFTCTLTVNFPSTPSASMSITWSWTCTRTSGSGTPYNYAKNCAHITVTINGASSTWNGALDMKTNGGVSIDTLQGTQNQGYIQNGNTWSGSGTVPGGASIGFSFSMSVDNMTGISASGSGSQTSYYVSYAANGGSSTPATQYRWASSAVTLASAISRSNSSTANTATYTHTFNGNGGTPSPTTKTTYRQTYTSYAFNKWWSGSTSYAAGASYNTNANITLTASWSGTAHHSYTTLGTLPSASRTSGTGTATRTVTYAPNGGSVSPTSATSTAKITYAYSLNGWWTASSGGTQITTGSSYSSAQTFYAHWNTTTTTGAYTTISPPTPTRSSTSTTANLTHTFNSNGGNTPSATTKTTTKTTTTYYSFNKWWNGTTSYAAGTAFTPSGNMTLTACWTTTTGTGYSALGTLPTCTKNSSISTVTRTVTFNANGGSVSPTSASTTSTTTIAYSLNGWYTATSGGSKISTTTAPTANTTYYAQWGSSTTTSGFGSVNLPTPTWATHKVTGWYTASSGGTKRGDAASSYAPTANETIYAQWIASGHINIGGTWKDAKSIHVNVNGTWKTATAVYVKVGDTWKKI